MRILLIDDDKDDQTLFREAVTHISQEIICDVADNGQEGLALLNMMEDLPQVVFLDVNMPFMDGRETIENIRSTTKLQGLNVVMYSTSNSSTDILWFAERQAQYMIKPNNFETLIAQLRERIVEVLIGDENELIIRKTC